MKSTKMQKETDSTLIPSASSIKNEQFFRKAFWASLVFMLGLLWFVGYDSGVGSDEMDMNIYGKANIAYYTSGFKDTTYLHPDHHDGTVMPATLPYYGSAFEYFATGLTSLLGDDYEYNTRHALNQFIAILGILFIGLIVVRIKNHLAALLCIWLLYLTPLIFGLSIFDTKDVPFMSAYVACIFFIISFFDEIPKARWLTAIGLSFSLWFLLSIRIGGLIMIGFIGIFAILAWYKNKEIFFSSIKDWGLKLGLAIALALGLMILLWPFVLQNPIENITKTLNVVKDFPQKILVAFDGEYIDSLNLPKSYLPKMFSISIPIISLIVLLIGVIMILANWKKVQHKNVVALLGISGFFPIFFAIYTHMPLYNSWRHLMFVFPSFVALGSIGFVMFTEQFTNQKVQFAMYALIAIGFTKPIIWCIKNSPYQYTYFNELAGSYEQVYYNYDTDYWQITTKAAIDWLMKNEPISNSKDTQIIATNAYSFSNYYLKSRYPGVKVKALAQGEKSNFGAPGTYTIFNNLFLEPLYLEHCFPSPFSIHTIDIDGKPITYVAKDTAKYLYKGYRAFENNDAAKADSFFDLYLNQIQYKFDLEHMTPFFGVIAFTKYVNHKDVEAFTIASKCVVSYPSDYISNLALGAIYIARKDYKNARYYLSAAQQIKPEESAPKFYLDQIMK